jgi:hypothetical protein
MTQSFTIVPCVTETWPMTRFGFGGGNGGSPPSPGPIGGSAFAAEAKLSAANASTAGSAMRRNVWTAFMMFPFPRVVDRHIACREERTPPGTIYSRSGNNLLEGGARRRGVGPNRQRNHWSHRSG